MVKLNQTWIKFHNSHLKSPPSSHIRKHYIAEVLQLKVMMRLLKDSSKNIQISAFHIFKVFVANPSKPRKIKSYWQGTMKSCWRCSTISFLANVVKMINLKRKRKC
ncbi:putative MO25-like protein At4g17270 isoform X2 [Olea europaea var. sylvestris]|uniref:putative MO25-like protein At4g17270 isoform X2 n=1 Tax=Olea europaea var. sylvestris TaxID=158386 RepID=UPI000C1D1BD2|nr:putative MO25-like protein At4g17270 isoform X2 [Olea europaea var. sylvestris]XP_022874714.1 putative MO25-like protein At4g17270 isoform X2 [Olea europaea var. sylvestris]